MLPEGQKLFLVRGLSGSGKTYLGEQLAEAYDTSHWETDSYFFEDGVYHWDRTRVQEAHLWCNKMVAKTLAFGDSVVVSNTFTQIWHMEPYIGMAMMLPACKVYIIEPNTPWAKDVEECIKRNAHDIPRQLVIDQAGIWEEYGNYGNEQVTHVPREDNDKILLRQED